MAGKHCINGLVRVTGLCVALGLSAQASAANVAVFNDPGYVDTAHESASIQASLVGLGHTVSAFSGITAANFTAATASTNLVLFPHLEPNLGTSLADALDASAIAALQSYVNQGGGLIAVGSDAHSLLNTLFYGPFPDALASSGLFPGGGFLQPDASGTAFALAPAHIDALPGLDTGLNFFAFTPPGSLALYRDSVSGTAAGPFNSTTVFVDDIGAGNIGYLAWSWLDATAGEANGGWNPLLDLVVEHVASPAAVPLPGAMPLMMMGCAVLLGRRRRSPERAGVSSVEPI